MDIYGHSVCDRYFEIGIIADNKEDAIFAECKWTNEAVLETLVERSGLFRYGRKYI
ncbi:MAG: hypothetical protein LBT26_04740 [Clostridiales Family XIII bacterium]|nr:hypothetical protein [Clostridiales Family XIII bacterium]